MLGILIRLTFFLLFGCGYYKASVLTGKSISDQKIIKGQVTPLSGLISTKPSRTLFNQAWASTCEATAAIYEIDIFGQKADEPIATTALNALAQFEFNLSEITPSNGVTHIIEVSGSGLEICEQVFTRPLAGDFQNQEVGYSSSILGFGLDINLPVNFYHASASDVAELILTLPNSSLMAAYNFLISNTEAKNKFASIFGIQPTELQKSVPKILSLQIFNIQNEGETKQFSALTSHWNPDYQVAYLWKLNGQIVSNSDTWSFTPRGDSDGAQSLDLYIGHNNGSGGIDITKPFLHKNYTLMILNTIPATAPSLSTISEFTKEQTVSISIETGLAKVNCESFSSMAITINQTSIPTSFPFSCTDEVIQNHDLQISHEGLNTIRLWVRDSKGRISAGPSSVEINLDTSPPELSLSLSANIVRGGGRNNISYDVNDVSGVSTNALYFTSNGTSYVFVANLNQTSSEYSFLVPQIDTSNARFKVVATDALGNQAEYLSSTFSIISTPPTAGVLSLVSNNITNSNVIHLSLSSCSGVDKILINEGETPSPEIGDWINCNTTLSFTLSGDAQGERTIHLWAKDVVNNISSTNSVTLTYDSLEPPAPTVQLITPSLTKDLTGKFQVQNCDQINKIIILSQGNPTLNDPNWQVCNTTTEYLIQIPIGDGSKNFSVWTKDLAGNISSSGSLLNLTLDQTPPVLNGVAINPTSTEPQGSYKTGIPLVNIKVNVIDTHEVKIKISNADSNNCAVVENSWLNHPAGLSGSEQTYAWNLNPLDGTKKVCVWAKDKAGNESIISSNGVLGMDTDTILFDTGSIPRIQSLVVTNLSSSDSTLLGTTNFLAGDTVRVTWTVSDLEGLSNNPLTIESTTDNTNWTTLASNYGSLTLNPTSYTGYYDFPAPRSHNNNNSSLRFFKVRIRATDATGNSSVAVQSQSLNTGRWSIFAGTNDRGLGGTAKAASLSAYGLGKQTFAVHPITNDIYALDLDGGAIIKINATTGIASKFMTVTTSGATQNLSSNGGALPANPTVRAYNSSIPFMFDKNGFFYILTQKQLSLAVLYQIDLNANTSRIYVGLGTSSVEGELALNSNIFIHGGFAFDSSNNLYFFTVCDPTLNIGYTSNGGPAAANTVKLMKVPQINNGGIYTGGASTHLAGNCTRTSKTFGIDARETSIYTDLPIYMKIAVNHDGSQIFILPYSAPAAFFKIINGITYSTASMNSFTLAYNSTNDKFYTHVSGQVYEFSGQAGNNTEVYTTIMGTSSNTGDCTADGIPHQQACLQTSSHMEFSRAGTLLIGDGLRGNQISKYRIRFKDENGFMRTLAGTKAFNGSGVSKELLTGTFSHIHYKQSTDPNLYDNPEGLYFISRDNSIYGRIEATDHPTESNKVKIIWGNQTIGSSGLLSDGATLSENLSVSSLLGMTFDESGYPWLFYNSYYVTKIIGQVAYRMMRGSTSPWDLNTSTPSSSYLSEYGSWVPYNNNMFVLGKSCSTSSVNNGSCTDPQKKFNELKYFDFNQNTGTLLFGGNVNAWTNDSVASGNLSNMSFTVDASHARMEAAFGPVLPRFYYIENVGATYYLRYIEDPLNPTNARLKTILTVPAAINGYTLNPDNGIYPKNSMIFYLRGSPTAQLYCAPNPDFSGAPAWCNGSVLGPNGPTIDLPWLSTGNRSLTWKDGNTLLINADTMIFQYNLN